MNVFCVNIAGPEVGFEIREQLCFRDSTLQIMCDELATVLNRNSIVLISDPSMFSAFFVLPDSMSLDGRPILEFLSACTGLDVHVLQRAVCAEEGRSAIAQLFKLAVGRVSGGASPPVMSDCVSRCYALAIEAGTVDRAMHILFDTAIELTEEIESGEMMRNANPKVVAGSVEVARHVYRELVGKKVVATGTDGLCPHLLQAFSEVGVNEMIVAGEDARRSIRLAGHCDAVAVDSQWLGDHLLDADIVIGAFEQRRRHLTRSTMDKLMRLRGRRPLVCFDAVAPRSIEPSVQSVPGVYLYNIDDLSRLAAEGWAAMWATVGRIEPVIDAAINACSGRIGSGISVDDHAQNAKHENEFFSQAV